MMLNGRIIPRALGRHNLSTAAWIGIGVVVVGAGALAFCQVLDNASE